jgi:predicted dehydrogenase
VIDSGVDVVLLATPPGFRPQQLRGMPSRQGKHVFCEKPMAVDAPGVRTCWRPEAGHEKNLSLVAGFCWRYSNYIRETFDQIKNGAIGDIVAYYATYYTSPVKPMPPADTRPAGMSDVEWQIRNWYNFCWLCGDSLVEQAVHSVDKVAWAINDQPPVSCVATGGRQIPAEGGNIYDHFSVNYLYPNNVRAFVSEPPDGRLLQRERRLHHGLRRACAPSAAARRRALPARQLDLLRARRTTCTSRARRPVRLHPPRPAINDGEWMDHSTCWPSWAACCRA